MTAIAPVTTAPAIDEARLMGFLNTVVNDFGAVLSSALVLIGDKLGLYQAMADGESVTSTELAARTSTSERYVREWLVNQAAGSYLDYDLATDRYRLPYEHALVLTGAQRPVDVAGGFRLMTAAIRAEERIAEAFRTGGGMPWGEHHHGLFDGTEQFFRAVYQQHLLDHWIPALDGVAAKLISGARVADIGCGYGASTIIMAQAFPVSRFYGYDNHGPSIERARAAASDAGVADRVTFEVADAATFPGTDYDLIAFCDCFHDLPNPGDASHRCSEALAPEGTVMVIEPMAGRTTAENLNSVGRVYSAASVLVCTPNALAGGNHALGTIATDSAIAQLFQHAGFGVFRRAAETPFNRVFEVRRGGG